MVPLKHLTNFWRTLEMSLINCEINLHRNLSKTALQWLAIQITENKDISLKTKNR